MISYFITRGLHLHWLCRGTKHSALASVTFDSMVLHFKNSWKKTFKSLLLGPFIYVFICLFYLQSMQNTKLSILNGRLSSTLVRDNYSIIKTKNVHKTP
jgi:hypothetical protein